MSRGEIKKKSKDRRLRFSDSIDSNCFHAEQIFRNWRNYNLRVQVFSRSEFMRSVSTRRIYMHRIHTRRIHARRSHAVKIHVRNSIHMFRICVSKIRLRRIYACRIRAFKIHVCRICSCKGRLSREYASSKFVAPLFFVKYSLIRNRNCRTFE